MKKGHFITLEGGDGAGKSTQLAALVAFLRGRGLEVVQTREVGGTEGGEEIRRLWLEKEKDFWDPLTEVMLIMAARRQHLVELIWPALARGAWVVSDRFVDSTRAYQGIGQGLGLAKIDEIYSAIAGNFHPDLTLYLDLPVELGHARRGSRNETADRIESLDTSFHEKLRQAFLDFAAADPARFRLIDARPDIAAVQAEIQKQVAGLLAADCE